MADDDNSGETQRLFELSLDLLCVAHKDGYFRRLNPAWSTTLGWSLEELYARPFIEFVHPDDRGSTLAEVAKLAAGHRTIRFDNRYRSRDGSYRWLSWTCQPDVESGILYAIARDVTEARRRERESETFSRMLAEELKQPLTSIMGGLDTLLRDLADEALEPADLASMREAAAWMVGTAGRMLDTTDALRWLSELAQDSMESTPLELGYPLGRALEQLQPMVREHGAVIRTPSALPRVVGHTPWLLQLWMQLLGDAIQYGGPSPEIDIEVAEAGASRVRILVHDNGPGLMDDDTEQAFEEFLRSQRLRAGSRGLGLLIVHRIVYRLGGELYVRRRPAGGSSLSLTLRAAAGAPEA